MSLDERDGMGVVAVLYLCLSLPAYAVGSFYFYTRKHLQPIKARSPWLVLSTNAVFVSMSVILACKMIAFDSFKCLGNLWLEYIFAVLLSTLYAVRTWLLFHRLESTYERIRMHEDFNGGPVRMDLSPGSRGSQAAYSRRRGKSAAGVRSSGRAILDSGSGAELSMSGAAGSISTGADLARGGSTSTSDLRVSTGSGRAKASTLAEYIRSSSASWGKECSLCHCICCSCSCVPGGRGIILLNFPMLSQPVFIVSCCVSLILLELVPLFVVTAQHYSDLSSVHVADTECFDTAETASGLLVLVPGVALAFMLYLVARMRSLYDNFLIRAELTCAALGSLCCLCVWLPFRFVEDLFTWSFHFSTLLAELMLLGLFLLGTVWPVWESYHVEDRAKQSAVFQAELRTAATELKGMATFVGLLSSTEGYTAFRDFLAQEFSVENLLFWTDVEDFRAAVHAAAVRQQQQQQQQQQELPASASASASASVSASASPNHDHTAGAGRDVGSGDGDDDEASMGPNPLAIQIHITEPGTATTEDTDSASAEDAKTRSATEIRIIGSGSGSGAAPAHGHGGAASADRGGSDGSSGGGAHSGAGTGTAGGEDDDDDDGRGSRRPGLDRAASAPVPKRAATATAFSHTDTNTYTHAYDTQAATDAEKADTGASYDESAAVGRVLSLPVPQPSFKRPKGVTVSVSVTHRQAVRNASVALSTSMRPTTPLPLPKDINVNEAVRSESRVAQLGGGLDEPDDDMPVLTYTELYTWACDLYDSYVQRMSPMEVNLPAEIRRELEHALSHDARPGIRGRRHSHAGVGVDHLATADEEMEDYGYDHTNANANAYAYAYGDDEDDFLGAPPSIRHNEAAMRQLTGESADPALGVLRQIRQGAAGKARSPGAVAAAAVVGHRAGGGGGGGGAFAGAGAAAREQKAPLPHVLALPAGAGGGVGAGAGATDAERKKHRKSATMPDPALLDMSKRFKAGRPMTERNLFGRTGTGTRKAELAAKQEALRRKRAGALMTLDQMAALFEPAARNILQLMENDSFMRFQGTKEYRMLWAKREALILKGAILDKADLS